MTLINTQSLNHSVTSTLLLHTCCGICGAWLPEKLSRDFAVTIFYFNPNIHPREEYERRLAATREAARLLDLPIIEGEYKPREWFAVARGLACEREGGARCPLCFEFRLRRTAEEAKRLGFDYFATTLTVGRRKPAAVINPVGKRLAAEIGVKFLAGDFKKQGGETASQKRGKEMNLYHQNYCGCVYSKIAAVELSSMTAIYNFLLARHLKLLDAGEGRRVARPEGIEPP